MYLLMFVVSPMASTDQQGPEYHPLQSVQCNDYYRHYYYTIAVQLQDEITVLQRENHALKEQVDTERARSHVLEEQVTAGDRSRMQLADQVDTERARNVALERQIAHDLYEKDLFVTGRIRDELARRLREQQVRNVDAAKYFATPPASPSKRQSPRRQSVPVVRKGRGWGGNVIHHSKPRGSRLKKDWPVQDSKVKWETVRLPVGNC